MNYRETESSLANLEEQETKLNEQEAKLNEEYNALFENLKLSKSALRKCEDELDEIRFKGLTVSDEQKNRANQLLEIQDRLVVDQRNREAKFKMFQEKFEQLKGAKRVLQGNLEYRKVNAFTLEGEIKNKYNIKISKQEQIENLKNSPYSDNAAITSMLIDLNEELKTIDTEYEDLKNTYKNVVGKAYGAESKLTENEKTNKDFDDIEAKLTGTKSELTEKEKPNKDFDDTEAKLTGTESELTEKEKPIKEKKPNKELFMKSLKNFGKVAGLVAGVGVLWLLCGPLGLGITIVNAASIGLAAKTTFGKGK